MSFAPNELRMRHFRKLRGDQHLDMFTTRAFILGPDKAIIADEPSTMPL